MATTNNAVTVAATLSYSGAAPAVGMNVSGGLAFTDGDAASDNYVNVTTSPTALNADIGGDGFLLVNNPATIAGVANTTSIAVLCAAQAMGPVPPGACGLFPLASGTVYNATVASGTLLVGVSVVECDPNS